MTGNHNDIQTTIDMCQNTAQHLESLADQATNPEAAKKLREASHHLRMGVNEASFAMQQSQSHHQQFQFADTWSR